MEKLVIIMVSLLSFIHSEILPATLFNQSSYVFYSLQSSTNHFIYFRGFSSTTEIVYQQFDSNGLLTSSVANASFLNAASYSIRSFGGNTNYSNSVFVIFSPQAIYSWTNMVYNPTAIFKRSTANSNNQIYGVAQGASRGLIFVIDTRTSANKYVLAMVTNSTTVVSVNMGIGFSSGMVCRIVSKADKVVTLVENKLQIYSFNSTNMTLLQAVTIQNTMSTDCVDIDSTAQFYLYSNPSNISIYSFSNYSVVNIFRSQNISSSVSFQTVKFITNGYLLVSLTDGYIYQLDIQSNAYISVANKVGPSKFGWVDSASQIQATDSYTTSTTTIRRYKVNSQYKCGNTNVAKTAKAICPACLTGYNLISGNCLKNGTASSNGTSSNTSSYTSSNGTSNNNSTTTNTTSNNTTKNSTTAGNSTINNNTNTNPNNTNTNTNNTNNSNSVNNNNNNNSTVNATGILIDPTSESSLINETVYYTGFGSYFLDNQQAQAFFQILGKILTFASVRIFLRPLLVFNCLLDDLNGYRYHRTEYSDTLMVLLQKIEMTNRIRFRPWFYDFGELNVSQLIVNKTDFNSQWNQRYVDYQNYTRDSDPTQVYFLNSTSNIYTLTLAENLSIYAALKLLHLVFYLLRKKNGIFRVVYLKVMGETIWWTLIVTLVEVSMVSLALSCGFQLVTPSFFYASNKMNFIAMVLVLLVLFMYSLCFYSLVLEFAPKHSGVLLQRCHEHVFLSYRMEPTYLPFRTLLRSVVHSFFLENHYSQMVFLLNIDIIFVLVVLYMRKSFQSKVVFFSSLMYSLAFIAFDSYIFYEVAEGHNSQNREIVTFILILVLIFLMNVLFFSLLLPFIFRQFKKIKNQYQNNKVHSFHNSNNKNLKHNVLNQNKLKAKKKDKILKSHKMRKIEKMPQPKNHYLDNKKVNDLGKINFGNQKQRPVKVKNTPTNKNNFKVIFFSRTV